MLSPIESELKDVSSRYVRVVNHNKQVHCARYMDIVEDLLGIRPEQDTDSESDDQEEGTSKEQKPKE